MMKDEKTGADSKAMNVPYTLYSEEDLPAEISRLFASAREATAQSYVPYSSFRVGSAIAMEDGQVVTGSNQENASFPAGICSERVGLVKASTLHPGVKMMRIAIVAIPDSGNIPVPVTPCGICRQSLLEYEVRQDSPLEVWFYTSENKYACIPSSSFLLPFSFTKNDLKSIG
ncbi:cytidine deaminase [Roseivirga sp. BDSF3-8]|uniref:cytidine deaminase n=1 Tax=Roseivirga sp. BDSF3-8 TaxID=3241598 RepID=UPI003531F29A